MDRAPARRKIQLAKRRNRSTTTIPSPPVWLTPYSQPLAPAARRIPTRAKDPEIVGSGTCSPLLVPDARDQNDHPEYGQDDLRQEGQKEVGL